MIQNSFDDNGRVASSTTPTPAAATEAPAEATATDGIQNQGAVENLIGKTIAEVERDMIINTLEHCVGNRTHAANILGISIRTLRNKLNQYKDDGMDIPAAGSGS